MKEYEAAAEPANTEGISGWTQGARTSTTLPLGVASLMATRCEASVCAEECNWLFSCVGAPANSGKGGASGGGAANGGASSGGKANGGTSNGGTGTGGTGNGGAPSGGTGNGGAASGGKANGGDIGKLAVFAGVHKFPARVKCAILPWHAVVAAVEGRQDPVTTEREDT